MGDAKYNPNDIVVISDADHVRKRPQMYLGDIELSSTGNCLARESLCLAIDQLKSKTCSRVRISVESNETFCWEHDGIPLSVDPLEKYDGKTECEMVASALRFCELRANSEFVSDEICTVSLPVVNFLSRRFRIDNFHELGHFAVEYQCGKTESGIHRIGDTDNRGVKIEYNLDTEILGSTEFDLVALEKWFNRLPMDVAHAEMEWDDLR